MLFLEGRDLGEERGEGETLDEEDGEGGEPCLPVSWGGGHDASVNMRGIQDSVRLKLPETAVNGVLDLRVSA
ncbi:hypothetical protein Aple_050200 [Acrocarpospora pleiomorpha]|uniref:Uncharacterized protein n=1 Tax=Acrocarpospora pleiomorpha TaxID=90975 RepID=A0A5M3XSA6_9ACTN|nr:hypothetical protein Aple_050200 [Acrocarpospora pleiomorpha]